MRLRPLLVLALLSASLGSATAQSGPPNGKSVQWSVGAGVIIAPRPYAGSDVEVFPVPVVGVRAGAFFFQTIRMGVRAVNEDHFAMDLLAQARFDGHEPDDAPILAGTHERRMSADAGLRFEGKWKRVETELLAVTDALSRHDGSEIALRAGFPVEAGKWRITSGLGVRWQSDNLVDYYYGVEQDEAIPGRPAYEASETMNPLVEVKLRRPFASDKWSFLANLSYEWLGSEIRNSPIVDASDTFGGYFAFVRAF